MPLNKTIEQAAAVAGSQTALAKLIDVTPQNLSDIKLGKRACGLKKRIQIAEIAGVDRLRTIFEYFEDSLDDADDYEAEAKKTIRAMLDAFPAETDEKKPLSNEAQGLVSWRKRRPPQGDPTGSNESQ
jgi:hypothetical protein